MKWIAKALLQKSFSGLPNGEAFNYLLQRKTGGLPVSPAEFVEKVRLAHERIKRWEAFGGKALDQIQCFEFGAGWDLIGPLAYWSFGVDHQIVVDIRPHLRLELLQHTLQQFVTYHAECEEVTGRKLRRMEGKHLDGDDDLLTQFGIQYLAPLDAAHTDLPANSIDFISTNSTLEHIPYSSLVSILVESRRLLRDGGIQCHFIDMKDHFSYFDSSITKYNFLTLSDTMWSLLNSTIAYQNRLRYADYQRLFKEAGLRVMSEEVDWATAEERRYFRELKLTARFANTDSDEHLTAQILRVILGK